MVKIKMDIFVKKYQSEKYDLWIMGLENSPHPEDHVHHVTRQQSNNNNKNDHSYAEHSMKQADTGGGLIGGKRLPTSDTLISSKRKKTFKRFFCGKVSY